MTKTAVVAYQEIEAEAPKKASAEVRKVAKHALGQVVRQGDIYLHAVSAKHARGGEIKNRQLAPGVTTGSRHIATGAVKIHEGKALPEWVKPMNGVGVAALLGPLVRIGKKGATITHPEHAHVRLPEGDWQVTYQVDARTRARVQD